MRKIIILLILSLKIFSANQNFYEEYKELINKPDLLSNEQFKKGIEEYCTLTVIHSGHQVLHEKHIKEILPALMQ